MEEQLFGSIIQRLKERRLKKNNFLISLDELLCDLRKEDVSKRTKYLLEHEVDRTFNSPKIEVKLEDGVQKYLFKPIYNLRSTDDLLNLLKEKQDKSLGGILLEDIKESLPNADSIIERLKHKDEIKVLPARNKTKVVFINSNEDRLDLDEDLLRHWRNVTVEGLDDNKIVEYLKKMNITPMKGSISEEAPKVIPKVEKHERKPRTYKRKNVHLEEGLLHEYDPKLSISSAKKRN